MNRRAACRLLGSGAVGVALSAPRAVAAPVASYTVKGDGPVLITFDRAPAGSFDPLASRYRVVVIQYPPEAPSADFIESFTADRVSADILAVADAVGASRFAWFGFSWGAVAGLQLAARTDRLTALICGGWPPIGAQYAETLAVTEVQAARGGSALFRTYYRSLRSWDERAAVSAIKCPRFVFAGRQDRFVTNGGEIHIGQSVAEHQAELERMGWVVRFVDGIGHELGARPDLVLPLIRGFLDPLLHIG